MNTQLVSFDFQSHAIPFTADAFVNLTEMCSAFGKRPAKFLELDSTQRFLVALAADTGLSLDSKCPNFGHLKSLVCTVRGQHGGGTWAHPDLALECARWLSPEFAIWTNRTIRRLLSGEGMHAAQDFRELARINCRLAELTAEAAELRRRKIRMTRVEANVSLWAYTQAAGVKLERTQSLTIGNESRALCLHEGLPVGTVMQRHPGCSARHPRRTFPPVILHRVITALGFKHKMPAMSLILKLWQPMLPLSARRAA